MLTLKKIGLWIAWTVAAGWTSGQENGAVFGERQALGSIDNPAINEASGLVASQRHAGWFWTHNDSGDKPRIFLIDDSAHYKATWYLSGISAYDWEDIGLMERGGDHYLLIGDIGDNRNVRSYVQLHMVKEPDIPAVTPAVDSLSVGEFRSFILRYADGPRDAEALFFDPMDERLYVISKRDLEVGIYTTAIPEEALPEKPADTLTLRKVCVLPQTFVTSAAISADGTEVLIKNLLNVFYWKREPGETISDMLSRPAMVQPYQPEPQGEAITFARDGRGYYTLGEAVLGMKSILYVYPHR